MYLEKYLVQSVEQTGEWRKLHNAELHNLYGNADIIETLKSRRLRWGACCIDGKYKKDTQANSRNPKCKHPRGWSKTRWEYNIILNLKKVRYEGYWKTLAEDSMACCGYGLA